MRGERGEKKRLDAEEGRSEEDKYAEIGFDENIRVIDNYAV